MVGKIIVNDIDWKKLENCFKRIKPSLDFWLFNQTLNMDLKEYEKYGLDG